MENTNAKIIPLKFGDIEDDFYAGFGIRLGANILDGLFLLPFYILTGLLARFVSVSEFMLITIILYLIIFWYKVDLPKKYGGTPGKLIFKMKIIKIDSENIGWKQAFLRESVELILRLLSDIILFLSIFEINLPVNKMNTIITIIFHIWAWSEIIILLTNERKRSAHDFIAGTVVVKSKYIEKIREDMAHFT